MEQTKRLQSIKDFNAWFAEHMVTNDIYSILEPSPSRFPTTIHWECEEPTEEYSYTKLRYYFLYD